MWKTDLFGFSVSLGALVVLSVMGNVDKTVPLYKLNFVAGNQSIDLDEVEEHAHISPVGVCIFFLCVTIVAHALRLYIFRKKTVVYSRVVLAYSREFALSAPPMFVLFGYFSGCQTLQEAVFIYIISFTLMALIPISASDRICLVFTSLVYVGLLSVFAYSSVHGPSPPDWVIGLIVGLYVSFTAFAVPVWLGIIYSKRGILCFAILSVFSKLFLSFMLVGPGGFS